MHHAPDEGLTRLTPKPIILWVGPKHSGKTTSAAHLVQAARAEGFVVAGCLAPSVYANDALVGFDIVNLHSNQKTPLALRASGCGVGQGFQFLAEGLALGNEALGSPATKDADLIIVDEFGPLELAHAGWRTAADRLMTVPDAVLVLVVREELAAKVQQLYRAAAIRRLVAAQPESIDEVLALLKNKPGNRSH